MLVIVYKYDLTLKWWYNNASEKVSMLGDTTLVLRYEICLDAATSRFLWLSDLIVHGLYLYRGLIIRHPSSASSSQSRINFTSTMTRQTTPITLITLLVVAIIGITSGYSTPQKSSVQQKEQQRSRIVSRQSFLATVASTSCLTFLGTQQPAFAKEIDPALKGTKSDPEFQACLSKCIYDCTKPKGAEQKSRGECLPECKKTCAKTKEQASGKIMDRM